VGEECVTIAVNGAHEVSGRLLVPPRPQACFVFAHGAGAGMMHPFMQAMAGGLAERSIATLRYQFPYMERGRRRPDTPALAQATVCAAAIAATRLLPSLPLLAGGRSYGGRMTSHAHAASPLPGVCGLVFLGFPLHPPKRQSDERASHLLDIRIPMLFLQGTRDALAELTLLERIIERLGQRATLYLLHDADHSFHVPANSGRKDADVRSEMLDACARWTSSVMSRASA
jgi:predicted alpha/beta-hydrolase family hydrolase